MKEETSCLGLSHKSHMLLGYQGYGRSLGKILDDAKTCGDRYLF